MTPALPLSLVRDALVYGVFALAALVAPGVAIQRSLGIAIDPALVLPLGTALTAGTYWLSLVAGRPALYPLLLAAAGASLVVDRRRWRLAEGPSLRGAIPALVAVTLFLAASEYRFGRVAADGGLLADPVESIDTTLHVGVAWELARGYPADVPG